MSGWHNKRAVLIAYIATYDRNFSQSQGYDERKCYNNSLNLDFENTY